MQERLSDLFTDLEENPPSERLKSAKVENMHRAAGKLLDRSKYEPNPPLTDEMMATARKFCSDSTDKAWESEFYPFGDMYIVRWVTTKEIMLMHLRELVKFYASNDLFKDRIVELHTGAHCTAQCVIGTSEPKFSLADAQLVIDAGIKGGVYQINSTSDPPTYSYSVDYIDGMCYSRMYRARIPTVQKMELKDLSAEAKDCLFKLSRMHKGLLANPHLS